MKKIDYICILSYSLVAYALYKLTNAPGLFWGDGGEFLAASCTLGIGHAYGHPLFWLAGRLSTLLHPGDPAIAMHHLTALISAATCGIVALLVRDWCHDRQNFLQRTVIIFCVTGLYVTAGTIWTQATFIEVYNFQAFFISLAVYFLNRYAFKKGKISNLFVSAYFWGLSLTLGFYVILLIVLPITMFSMARSSRRLRLQHLLVSSLFLFLGLTVWLYLPIRSTIEPVFYWEKIESVSSFFYYLARTRYANLTVAGLGALTISLSETLKILMKNLSVWGFTLLIFCLWAVISTKEYRKVLPYFYSAIFLVLAFTLLIPLNLTFRQMVDMDVYYIPAFLVFTPVLTVGACKITMILKRSLQPLIIVPIVAIAWIRWDNIDISDNRIFTNFTTYLTSDIPRDSKIFPASDELACPLLYHVYVTGNSNDYDLLDKRQVLSAAFQENITPESERVFIEIDDSFLDTLVSQENHQLAGPFLVSIGDSAVAQRLESDFINHFSPEYLSLDNLNRLDRMSLARIWSRRGVYWFYVSKKVRVKGLTSGYVVDSFRKAYSLDDFSLEGALHASNLALSLISTGNLEEAESYARRAIALNSHSRDAYRALYNIALKKEQFNEALEPLKKLAKLKPKDGEIHLNMALVYFLLNQPMKAKASYQKGITLGGRPREKLENLLF